MDTTTSEIMSEFIKDMGSSAFKSKVNNIKQPDIINIKPLVEEFNINLPSNWLPVPEDLERIIINRKIYDAPFLPSNFKVYYDKELDRLIIPWVRNNQLMGYQGMAIRKDQTPKYLFNSDGTKDIFNFNMIDSDLDYVFSVEGCWDTIWVRNGITIGGTRLTDHQRELLSEHNCSNVYMLDNQWLDKTSYKKTLKLIEQGELVWIWPNNIKQKDQNEFLIINDYNPFKSYEWLKKHIYSGLVARMVLENGGVPDYDMERYSE
jgi:hypothetical protein